jgi:hypothetical protein
MILAIIFYDQISVIGFFFPKIDSRVKMMGRHSEEHRFAF